MHTAIQAHAAFTSIVHINNGVYLLFECYKIYVVGTFKYSVTVYENNLRITIFNMKWAVDEWKIVNAPQVETRWLAMEAFLSKSIKTFITEALPFNYNPLEK